MPGWRWSGGAQAHWCLAKAWKQRLYFKIRETETSESWYASYKFISAPPFLPSSLALYECMIFLWFFFKLPFRDVFSGLIPIALSCMCLPWSWGLTFPHSLPKWVKSAGGGWFNGHCLSNPQSSFSLIIWLSSMVLCCAGNGLHSTLDHLCLPSFPQQNITCFLQSSNSQFSLS